VNSCSDTQRLDQRRQRGGIIFHRRNQVGTAGARHYFERHRAITRTEQRALLRYIHRGLE
jgi:hypothetical protein